MAYTIAEKILMRASGSKTVEPGEIVNAKVDVAMSHDNAALVSKVFGEIGVPKVWDASKIVIPIDHRVPANNIKVAEGHVKIRNFVKKQGIKHFYDVREGVCHQIMPEFGHVAPGLLIVGTDSHTTTYGAFGAFSTGIGATEMAAVWASGELWLKVPETFKITLDGSLKEHVFSKDVILQIIGDLTAEGANYKSIEYYGTAVDEMSVGSRMTITNMSMEMGAKSAIMVPDQKVFDYLKTRTNEKLEAVIADADAVYEKELKYDVSQIGPKVACPHTVDNVKDVGEVAGTVVHQAVLGSCTNGRVEDLKAGSRMLAGKKIHDDVRLIIAPASRQVYLEAMEEGLIQKFVKAGAIVINPGCGPCLGAHEGIIAAGENCIASTNRNFQGRMGSTEAGIYLASPATVVASAVAGVITDPREGSTW
ncbi:MAG: 3-isopropylmalate dehydratase large subunit [Candidatus Thermoplasmatota archaeon]|nr:3-isopropylmalate dehydratase large subunit [Euryarchaeota archaeon]MBU4031630.1 3-isopropylmalate dehydratase large subunit [Candidatus Thermoplasmatota archaeon]MBU4071714.1 3-isopropylmalate dehydratase large subunit [Candidatus Thermoplasmatota archaeon]MBU4143793.1 3-isopropylmalate dehydratase large subunit [Candidatus Thermoplasmatota archaeon]MBU4591373.1 3-isopropylmalate dehydratase large subunit [Candidatus Thermoplasmatota archaeon]